MSFKRPKNIKDLLVHLAIISVIFVGTVTYVFQVFLPYYTNHGETIPVPNIVGMHVNDLEDFLRDKELNFEVNTDSGYSEKYPPFVVINQNLNPNFKVKRNRKVYVTLNKKNPPIVKMPHLTDLSIRSAHKVLQSYELKMGSVIFVPDIFFGVVHHTLFNGDTVQEDDSIKKGSVIDLLVGDGVGNKKFLSPNLLGLNLEEAKFVIIGSGLKLGNIYSATSKDEISEILPDSVTLSNYRLKKTYSNNVFYQSPSKDIELNIGDFVDIWVYQPDSILLE